MSYFDLNNDVKPDRIPDNDICMYMYIYVYICIYRAGPDPRGRRSTSGDSGVTGHALACNRL
jgi:hypothetical protein